MLWRIINGAVSVVSPIFRIRINPEFRVARGPLNVLIFNKRLYVTVNAIYLVVITAFGVLASGNRDLVGVDFHPAAIFTITVSLNVLSQHRKLPPLLKH